MDDIFDLALAPDTDTAQGQEPPQETDGSPPIDGGELDGNAGDETSPEQNPDAGTTADEGEADPEASEGEQAKPAKGALAKELEPFKAVLEAKGFDVSTPAGVAQVLKSYQEAESYAKRNETHLKTEATRAEKFAALARSDIKEINRFRKAQGLPEFKDAVRPLEDRVKEHDFLVTTINKIVNGEDADNALKALQEHFEGHRFDLEFEKRSKASNPDKTPQQAFTERKSRATQNMDLMQAKDPESIHYADEIRDMFDPSKGGIFHALGFDILDAAQTPEILAGFVEIGKAIHTHRNIEKIVQERVTDELERRRKAGNTGGNGRPGGKPQITKDDGAFDPTSLF